MSKKFSQNWLFLIVFILFFFYFFSGLKNISHTFWDESIYVNAARAYLSTSKPYPVPDHPPLGKELIAGGIYLFGDAPVGWRFFSVLFGALTCTLISYFIFRLTQNLGIAFFVAGLLFLEPFFVVHFRMGMLDPPLACFMVLFALLTYSFYRSPKLNAWWLCFACVALGLGLATKLLALVAIPWLYALAVYRVWREPRRWRKVLWVSSLFAFLPALIFLSTYWVLGYTTAEVWELVKFMFAWHRTAVGPSVSISRWYEWLYLKVPLWYFALPAGKGQVQAVMATGNFVLWIGAELALIYSLVRGWRRPEIWMLFLLVASQFLLYTQKRSTYIHYMAEVLPFLYVFLGVALADLWMRYGFRFKRILQMDFALFYLAALLVFLNYWPFLWGIKVSSKKFIHVSGWQVVNPRPPIGSTSLPSPSSKTP